MPESPQQPTPEWLRPAERAGAAQSEIERRKAQERAAAAKERRILLAGFDLIHADYGARAQAEAESMASDIIALFSQRGIEPYPQPSYKFDDHAQAVRIRKWAEWGYVGMPMPPERPQGLAAITQYWGWDITDSSEEWFVSNYSHYVDKVAGGLFLDHTGIYRVVTEIAYRPDDRSNMLTRERYGVQRVVWDPRLHAELLAQGENAQLFPTRYPAIHHVSLANDTEHDPGTDAVLAGQVADGDEQYAIWMYAQHVDRPDSGRPRLADDMKPHSKYATHGLINNFSDRTAVSFNMGDRLLETNLQAMAVSHGAFEPQ